VKVLIEHAVTVPADELEGIPAQGEVRVKVVEDFGDPVRADMVPRDGLVVPQGKRVELAITDIAGEEPELDDAVTRSHR
jgi:hypothetical protein